MAKKASLSSAFMEATGRTKAAKPVARRPTHIAANTPASSGRQGKKVIAGFFDPAVSRQLKQIGLARNRTVQDLLTEALNDFFQKHQKPTIA
jgi:hypothetical protein